MTNDNAVVLFSGGQDSTVCLIWALSRFASVTTVGFDYGQRHKVELDCRQSILKYLKTSGKWNGKRLGDDAMLDLSVLGQISETSLTRDQEIVMAENELPSTFVPGRNLIFLTLASCVAWRQGANTLVGGMCETDYSGYPDCRRTTLNAQQVALSHGLDRQMHIETPLMYLDKADTFALSKQLGGDELVSFVVEETHTCYLGDRTHRHDWGYGCGTCPACELRASGWAKWQSEGAKALPVHSDDEI